jgi:tetratricopeptide (TPR) repeat protein
MIIAALLLMQYSPETDAVMNRSRARAADKRAAARAVAPPPPASPQVSPKFQACLDAAMNKADDGVSFAEAWRIDGGGYRARECLGFSYARAERWSPALVAYEQAADDSERAGEIAEGARLWAQAGNAALAGGDFDKARKDFDAALARGLPDGLAKGEVYLDRARALVALGETVPARGDLDDALTMAPQDPLAWLLSATLARRMNDLPLAQRHIAQAVKLAPDDASVALEEGNIAVLTSQDDIARAAWGRAVRLSPDSAAGKASAANLTELSATKPSAPRP